MPPSADSERTPRNLNGAEILNTQNLEILSRAERGQLDCPRCESRLYGEPIKLQKEATTMLLCLQCEFREI